MANRAFGRFPSVGRSHAALYAGLLGANLVAWAWAFASFRADPVLLGMAALAYGLGLRHAVDADHIAAIDNVTRMLVAEGKRPVAVGLFFSLGHSTVVVAASALLALAASVYGRHVGAFQTIGGAVGTAVSAVFLFVIAGTNLVALRDVARKLRRARRGGPVEEAGMESVLAGGGLLARILRPMFGLIRASWHMYPLGLLFGLGFDTASEIGLLGLSATEGGRGLPIWSILVFPALFTAGMSLVDSLDGVLMTRAYGWAFVEPARKLAYNFWVTAISVAVALAVGTVELLALVGGRLDMDGPIWTAARRAADHFGAIGYLIVAILAGSWVLSLAIHRARRGSAIPVAPRRW